MTKRILSIFIAATLLLGAADLALARQEPNRPASSNKPATKPAAAAAVKKSTKKVKKDAKPAAAAVKKSTLKKPEKSAKKKNIDQKAKARKANKKKK